MGELPAFILVLLLTLVIAESTVVMAWVQRGSEIFVLVGFVAVATMAILALIPRLPAAISLGAGLVLAFAVSWYLTSAALTAAHPHDLFGLPSADTWLTRIGGGDQVDMTLFLFLGCVAFWFVGGWLAWSTLRWRRPLLGLYPGAAIFATNVLNSKDEQNANTLYFLLLTVALLLWNSYRSSLLSAVRSGLRMSSDSRWDFWETGVAASAVVMLLAIFVPPLTHDDQTVNVENGAFRGWAQFQQNLNHSVEVGRGAGAVFSTGFATDAGLSGSLKRSTRIVLVYSVAGQYYGPRYLRGVDLQLGTRPNQWAYLNNPFGFQFFISKNSVLPYVDSNLRELNTGTIQVQMIHPPLTAPDVLFYPGQLVRSDRDSVAIESYKTAQNPTFGTVDRVASSKPPTSAGSYKVVVNYSNPTEDELRNAGAAYPDWLTPYLGYPGLTGTPAFTSTGSGSSQAPANSITIFSTNGAASPTALKIKQLADRVTAPFSNNYDKASGIEAYLRSNYTYSLTIPPLKEGVTDPIDAFLFDSKQGYCEYFATAMGDMLRAEGIPTRLVNGFGPGTFDPKSKTYVVRESDAHSWVEAYFPGYGWIQFEPTPDGVYFPISRAQAPNSCTRDTCTTGSDDTTDIAGGTAKGVKDITGDLPAQSGGLGGGSQVPYWLLFPLGLLLVAAVLFFAASRYLRPHTADQVWSRMGRIARLSGFTGPPGETPSEFGRRLAAAVPEAARPIRELVGSFTIVAYAPPELAMPSGGDVVARWQEIRPHLVRRLMGRLRLTW